jgi:hypothetical protein
MTVTSEVLWTWREAERLLAALPPLSPDEKIVRLAILTLRDCYQDLTRHQRPPSTLTSRGRETVDRVQVLLIEIRSKMGPSLAIGDGALSEAPS